MQLVNAISLLAFAATMGVPFGYVVFKRSEWRMDRAAFIVGTFALGIVNSLTGNGAFTWLLFAAYSVLAAARCNALEIGYKLRLMLTCMPVFLLVAWPALALFASGTPRLHLAAADGNVDLVTYELDKGVDVDNKDKKGATALMYAARNGHSSVVALLLKRGASWKVALPKGETALSIAQRHQHSEVVELLQQGSSAT